MELVCFLCQEYEIDIGHQTILCPKQFCKICQQKGHFAMNCKTFCKDFATKDEQMVKLENEDETKTEIHFDDHPCKVETKMENYITVKKDLVKTENRNCGEFSKSEEDSLMYCLESMPPADTKKRKIDSEKDLPLEEVQQKIIGKLSNDLVNLTESKGKMEVKYESRITDLKERLSKNVSIIETLRECKKKLEVELNDVHETTVSKSLLLKNSQLKQFQSKIIQGQSWQTGFFLN